MARSPQSKGGIARAASMSPEDRSRCASLAAKARWGDYTAKPKEPRMSNDPLWSARGFRDAYEAGDQIAILAQLLEDNRWSPNIGVRLERAGAYLRKHRVMEARKFVKELAKKGFTLKAEPSSTP